MTGSRGFRPWLPFEWIVAARFLREGRLQTLFIIAGVAVGVGVIVFMSALLAGGQANFIHRVLSAQAHIQLLPPPQLARPQGVVGGVGTALGGTGALEAPIVQAPLQRLKGIDQWPTVAAQIRALPEVTGVTPLVSGSALAVRGSASRAVSLAGVDPAGYFRIIDMAGKIVRGSLRLSASDMLIGTELASDLGVDVGDKLRLTAANGASTTLTIAGVFDLGNKGANQRTTFVSLHIAQSLMGLPGGATSLEVTVRDVYAAESVARQITRITGVEADSWIKTSAQFFAALSAQSTANTVIRFFVGLSVAFGIASVLVVVVVQRSREIGILRAMGITQGQILRVFLLQGGLLGLGGSVAGCAIGVVALFLWQHLATNADGTPMFALTIDPELFAVALLVATFTGLGAAVAPALRAARLDPVEAIRA